MKYSFLPDSFRYTEIASRFKDQEEFLGLQFKYKKQFEDFLSRQINFHEVISFIKDADVTIPRMKDEHYNFYHANSDFGINYLFLRNNIHVENLTEQELQTLRNSSSLDDNYLLATVSKVLYEEGEFTYFGPPMDETLVASKSIIFEFAYNQVDCTSVEQLNRIREIIRNCFAKLQEEMSSKLDLPCSFLIYNGIPNLFLPKEEAKII